MRHNVETRTLQVGDVCVDSILSHEHGSKPVHKVVVDVNPRHVTFITYYGKQLRVRKFRHGFPTREIYAGHVELTDEAVKALTKFRKSSPLFQARFVRGVLDGLPRFGELLGYGTPEDEPRLPSIADGDIVRTQTLRTGDTIAIMRMLTTCVLSYRPTTLESWGVGILDPEFGHPYDDVGWLYRDMTTAEAVATRFQEHRESGKTLEDAIRSTLLDCRTFPRADTYTLDDVR